MRATKAISCSSSKARCPAASAAASLLFTFNHCFLLFHTTIKIITLVLLLPPPVYSQEMSWYVTWTAGKLCDKKPAAEIETWESSYTTLQACCDAKFNYDYDNCCNPTFSELGSCLEESLAETCEQRTCSNGLYSQSLCQCVCIPPFTLDSAGDCTTKGSGAIENPFASCVINVDCPWWSNPMLLEKCDSGSEIPEGIYTVDWTREECCERHHPGSTYCIASDVDVLSNIDELLVDFDSIPVKFSISNLPDNLMSTIVDINKLKQTVRNVLKDVVLELSQSVEDLGVNSVQESTRYFEHEGGKNQLGGIDIYYDVNVIPVLGQDFTPIIIQEMFDSFQNIEEEIQGYVRKEVYVNICMNDGQGEPKVDDQYDDNSLSAPWGTSLFDKCTSYPEEVTITFRFKDLPQAVIDNTIFFDNIKMQIMEAYRELVTDDDDASTDGMILLSIVDKGEVSLPDGIIDVFFKIIVKGVYEDVKYASAIEEKIASSRQVIVTRLQKFTATGPNRDVIWCTKEEDALTVCAPGEEEEVAPLGGVNGAKALPGWAYSVIIVTCVVGMIVLFCLCRVCECEGCFNNRKISRGPTRNASYNISGHPARRPSKRSKRSSFDYDNGVMRRRLSGSGMRYDRRRPSDMGRRRSDMERRRASHRHERRERNSSRKRSRRITNDLDSFSISTVELDTKKQENQIVLYEGVQTEQLVICDDEEKQAERPDPDGISANRLLTGVYSIATKSKDEYNDAVQLEEEDGDDGRLFTFTV